MTEPLEPGREPAAVPPSDAPTREPSEAGDAAPAPAGGEPSERPSEPTAGSAPAGGEPSERPSEPAAGSAPEPPGRGSGRGAAAVAGYVGAVVLGILIGAGALAVATGAIGRASPSPSPTPIASAAPAANAVGRPYAPVTIEVWADYQCPYCRLDTLLYGPSIMREYVDTGIARMVYRDFAFLGRESTDAAVAARCAGIQEPDAQLRYHDALFTFQQGENQGRFARANLLQVAQIVGVPDTKAFTTCLDDPAVAAAVAAETTEGRSLGVESTPTMRISGPGGLHVVTGFSQSWTDIRDAIEAARVPAASPSPGGSASPSPSAGSSSTPAGSPSATPAPSPSPSGSPAAPATGTPAPGASATP